MILHSLKMQNFRQHLDTFIPFERGLTGIVGTNGAGKSTVLEGIIFALYGTQAARGTKESIKSRRAGDRATVRVELVFDVAGHRYRVTRGLTMAEVYIDGAESPIANSLSGVSEFLQRTLGMTRQEFLRTYFSAQKDLAAMASMSGPDKAKFLARALGHDQIERAQKLATDKRKETQTKISVIRQSVPDLARAQTALEQEIERVRLAEHQLQTATAARNAATDALALITPRWESAQETRERDQRLASDIQLVGSQIDSLNRDKTRLEAERASIVAARTEHDQLGPMLEKLPALRAELTELDRIAAADVAQQQARGRVAALDEQLARNAARLQEYAGAEDNVAKATQDQSDVLVAHSKAADAAVAAVNAWMEEKAQSKSTIDRLRTRHQELKQREAELLSKGSDGSCTACGKPLGDSWQQAMQQIASELEEVVRLGKVAKELAAPLEKSPVSVTTAESTAREAHAALRAADARVQETKSLLGEKVRIEAEQTRLSSTRAIEQAKLDAVAQPYNAARHVEVRSEIDALSTTDKRVAVLAGQLARESANQSELAIATEALTSAEGRRRTLQSERDAIGFNEGNFVALRAEHSVATEKSQQTETAAIAAKHEHERAVQAQQFAQKEVERTDKARKEIETLESQRLLLEELERAFTELRTQLNKNLRPELAEIASGLLDVLTDGRYTEAEFDENYVLTLVKDGVSQQVISGGEEDLCNLVLRLAISQMIASRAGHSFGLLILDEVFGSMDDTRRSNVVELLRALNDRFEQVIVITHIGPVRDGLDHVIQVSYDENRDCSVVTTGDAATRFAQAETEIMAAA